MMCQSCENNSTDVIMTIVGVLLAGLLIGGLIYMAKRRAQENRKTVKRFKNGGKIMFAGSQITASLPSVIPTMALPENFKEVVKAASILNLDMFSFVSVGCFASVNYYDKTMAMTLLIIGICSLLLVSGLIVKKYRSWCFTAAIAITYLVLPTVTTTIFGVFPCDRLDDGQYLMRKDYTISCDGEGRDWWLIYGYTMVLVFPIGEAARLRCYLNN